jgi:hypothetical protein
MTPLSPCAGTAEGQRLRVDLRVTNADRCPLEHCRAPTPKQLPLLGERCHRSPSSSFFMSQSSYLTSSCSWHPSPTASASIHARTVPSPMSGFLSRCPPSPRPCLASARCLRGPLREDVHHPGPALAHRWPHHGGVSCMHAGARRACGRPAHPVLALLVGWPSVLGGLRGHFGRPPGLCWPGRGMGKAGQDWIF